MAPTLRALRSQMRRAAKETYQGSLPATNWVGTCILAQPTLSRALNIVYEQGWLAVSTAVNRLMDQPILERDFLWRCEFAGQQFGIPVVAGLPRSWSNARVWRWAPALPMRRIYETYLSTRRPGIMFDIGANDGMHTYPFAAHGWECVAFEPQPSCARYLQRTVEANGFNAIRIVMQAVGSEAGKATFYVSDSTWYSSLRREMVERFEESKTLSVDVTSVDTFCAESGLHPAFMKIDVEGSELSVLEGAAQTLRSCRPDLLVEILKDADMRANVWKYAAELDYHVLTIPAVRGQPAMWARSATEFIGAGDSRHTDFFFTADSELLTRLIAASAT